MKKWGSIIIAAVVIVGVGIGLTFGKLFVPDMPSGTIWAGMGGSVAGILVVFGIEKLRQKRKKNNVPEVDERTWMNIKSFYAFSLYFVLIGSMLLVCILYAAGMKSVELGAVSIYLLVIFMLLGIGTLIVKRR